MSRLIEEQVATINKLIGALNNQVGYSEEFGKLDVNEWLESKIQWHNSGC